MTIESKWIWSHPSDSVDGFLLESYRMHGLSFVFGRLVSGVF